MPDDVPAGWPPGFGDGDGERRALLVLSTLRGITPRNLHALAWRAGSAAAALAIIRRGGAGSRADHEHAVRTEPDQVLDAAAAAGARFVVPGDGEYPRALLRLADPPAALFLRGGRLDRREVRVAVVGSRRCSASGREIAHDLGRRLAGAGLCVVSGAAFGIDAASHHGALAAAGRTVAVLGSGIDRAYPRSSAELIDRIAAAGTLVSEYAPGVPAEPHRFPARNRIVTGLSSALVVVEGAHGSGSRISVDHALDIGLEVFAVPGPVTSPLAEVPLELIRDGATMIRGADDLLADLEVDVPADPVEPPVHLSGDERRAWAALAEPSPPDVVARGADLSIPQAVSALIRLELRGLVRSVGGRYERTLAGARRESV